jgi:chemotaxis response regulator CheB
MPKAAFEAGAVERQLPLERIAPAILQLTNRQERS